MVATQSVSQEMGQRIRDLRQDQQLSQADLADRLGIQPQVISDVERGKKGMTVDRLYRYLDALGYQADISISKQPETTRTDWGPIKAQDPARRQAIRRAREVAEAVADHLYDRYAVDRVAVFGSLVEDQASRFDEYSDIDLLVQGLQAKLRFRAETTVEMEVLPELTEGKEEEFSIDIVREEAYPENTDSLVEKERATIVPSSTPHPS